MVVLRGYRYRIICCLRDLPYTIFTERFLVLDPSFLDQGILFELLCGKIPCSGMMKMKDDRQVSDGPDELALIKDPYTQIGILIAKA